MDGYPNRQVIDKDEDGKPDLIAYDFNQDGTWDKFQNIRKIIVKSLSLFFILFLAFLFSFKAEAKSWIGVEFNKVSEEFLKINNLDLKSPKNIFINNVVKTLSC